MKKLIVFASMLFLMACGNQSVKIEQKIAYDNVNNNYSITTSFSSPDVYSSCVYCAGPKIDSIRKVEFDKATYVQTEMIKKQN